MLLRAYRQTVGLSMILLIFSWQIGQPLQAATLYWDQDSTALGNVTTGGGLGGTGTWDITSPNWWNGVATDAAWINGTDIAIFTGTAGTVTLGGPITAGGLTFNSSGYTIAGGGNILTLTAPSGVTSPLLAVNNSGLGTNRATISASLAGTSGFTKTGNGTLVLGGANTGLSGDVAIKGGNLVVTSQGQLGTGTTAISITGIAGTGNPGYSGGTLVLDGSSSIINFTREISVAGRGPGTANASGGVVSIGYNTLAGNLTLGNAATEGRAVATHGITTLSGNLNLGTGAANILFGNGNWIVSGRVLGTDNATDRFIKSGTTIASTLWLQNSNNSFAQTMRIDSGTVRVSTPSALGFSSVTTGAVGSVDLNGAGTTQGLEIRSDTTNWGTIGFRVRGNSNGITVDHSIGNYTTNPINQTITFGNISMDLNANLQVNGRNGFNSSFSGPSGTITWTNGGTGALANASNGTMTVNANISRPTETTTRTLTLTSTGEMVLTGNILEPTQGTGSIVLTKAGTGTLTIQGTAGTYTGATNVNAGTLNISSIGALNDNTNAVSTGRVVFGGGTLNYTGAAQTWTNKVLLLNATNNILTSNGTGALVVQPNIVNNGTGAKNLVLGGANTNTNDIQGIITNTTVGAGVTKYDSGLWQISSPGTTSSTIGTANAAFGITAVGTTASSTITTTSTTGLVVGQPISGTGVPFSTVISQIISPTQFTTSQNLTSTGSTVVLGTVTGATTGIATTAVSAGTTTAPTLTFGSTANLVVGQQVTGTGLTGSWYISAITSGTVVTLASTTGSTVTVGGVASGVTITPTSSPNFGGPLTITGGTVQLNPLAAAAASPVLSGLTNVVFAADTIRNNGFAGGTLNYKAFSTGSTQTAGILSVTAGAGTVQITPGASGTNTLTFGSMVVPATGTSLNLVVPASPGTNSIAFTTGNTLVNGIVGARAYFNGADFLGGTTTAAAATYSTFAGGAALTTANTLPYFVTGDVTAQTTATINAGIKFSSARALTLASGQTLTLQNGGNTVSGGILQTGGFSSTISGGTGITSGGAAELVFRTDTASDTLTLSTPILVGTTGGFSKNGAGTLVLNAVNAGAASTINVNEGTLRLSGATTTLGATNMNLTVRQGTTLDVNGVNVSATPVVSGTATLPLNALAGAGTVTNGNAGTTSTIAIGSGNTAGIFSGIIQNGAGTVALTKTGTATQTLTGLNTFTGPLTLTGTGASTIAATTLANIGVASSIGRGDNTSTATNQASIVFASGANTILYTGASTSVFQTTQTPSVSIDRLFTITGGATGTIDSSGQFGNNTAAASSANNATLVFNNTNAIAYAGSGTATLGLAGTSTGDNRFVPLLNNANFALTKSGVGLWILDPTSSNTYAGATTITGGALQVAAQASLIQGLSANSNLTLNGGVLQTSGTFAMNLGTGAGQVQFTGIGGFAASTSKLTVNLSSGATLALGTAPTAGSTLILSSTTALADVELINPINLGTAARTIQVDDNGTTNLDFATVSGVISGGAGGTLTKSGAGTLIVGNANTYTANTILNNGSLIVTSLGNASGTASSSLGASGGTFNWNGDAALNLLYVGSGETSSRPITFTPAMTAARTYTIDSSGSGALSLSSITNSQTGAFALTLQLRGTNTDNNVVTSVLGNGANTLAVTKADGGVWILNPASANTFTGAISSNGGLLGLTANGIGAASAININNGGIFAFGGALTTAVTVQGNNSTGVFAGQNAITLNNSVTKTAGNNQWTISNNLENGALLTVNGNFVNAEAGTTAATQTISFRGYGSTLWNGAITENAAAGGKIAWNIGIHPDASFTMAGAANTYTGATTLVQGRLILNKTAGVNPLGATSTFAFNGGEVQGSFALTGTSAIATPITLGGDPATFSGGNSIELSAATALSLAASRLLVNNISGGSLTITGNISNTAASTLTVLGSGTTTLNGIYAAGTGANALTYSGTGTFTSTGANTATGALTVNRGAVTLSGPNGAWTAGTFTLNAGTLTLDNSVNNNSNRLFDTGAISMVGGTLSLIGNTTAEVAGALTVTGPSSINMSGVGTNSLTFASVTFTGSPAALDISGVTGLGTSNQIFFTTSTGLGILPATSGIVSKVMIAGDFVSYNHDGTNPNANGLQAFTGYNTGSINTAPATATMSVNASTGLTASRTINALKITGTGLTVGTAGRTLTLTAGNILNTGGNNAITAAQITGGQTLFLQTDSGTTLDLNGALVGQTIQKTGAGQLNLNAAQFYNTTTNIAGGTVRLNGGMNTLFAAGSATPGTLSLDVGTTLDLNGNTQYVGALNSYGSGLPGTSGTVTSTTGTPTFVTRDGGSFGGQITGGINFVKTGANAQTFAMAQTYTGTTSILGQTITLENDGALTNTSAIDINYAGLTLSNNTNLQTQNNNRINDAAPITLRGGTITYTGRVGTIATETFGAISLAQGSNTITATPTAGSSAFSSVDLTFGALTRTAGSTINFTGTNLGQQGNNARIVFASAPAVVGGGILGAWAVANQTDYAAYNAGQGVGVVGQGGYTGYNSQNIGTANTVPLAGVFASGSITNLNATAAASTLLPSGTTTTGLLRIGGAFTNDILFTGASDVLNLELGGILRSDNANNTTIGTTGTRGIITSGTSELITYNNQGTLTINSAIQGALALIKDGASILSLTNDYTGNASAYSGGTIVNRGTLNLNGAAGAVVIPGNLTINGGVTGGGSTVAMITNAGQIATTSNVTINGQGTLTLVGNNTLNSVTFNNIGGNVNTPTINVGGILTLSSSSPITATSSNAATTAIITGGTVALASGANTFSIAPIAVGGVTYTTVQPTLTIASIIANGASPSSISKTGDGILLLSGANTYTGGTTVGGTSGGLMLGSNAASIITAGTGLNANAILSGPAGTGSVSMASGTALLTNDTDRTLANPITFLGTPTFRNTTTGTTRTITLNGSITTPTGALTVNVDNPNLTAAFVGPITTAGSLTSVTKTGLGNLIINLTGAGAIPISLNDGGTLGLLTDGDGDVQNDVINVGAITMTASPPTISIGRAGQTVLWNQAINKIITPTSFSSLASGLTVNNANQYQLALSDGVALSTIAATPVFNVATANNSNTNDGLVLSGIVSGGATGASNVVLTKSGAGTLALTGVNTFGGSSAIIDVTAGILSVNANSGLGEASNVVRLSANSGTQGLRLAGGTTYTLTGRTINLNAATVGIDVAANTTATIDTAFTFSAAANALQKNDFGTLIITANNSTRTGTTTIAQGVVQIDNVNALGSGQINVAAPGTNTSQGGGALWLTNNINLASPINLATGGGNGFGINNTGAVFSASGNNTLSGSITNTSAVGYILGAASGATLNITAGAMANTNSPTFNAVGTGIINLASYTPNTAAFSKIGTGTLNLTGTASSTAAITVTQGTFNISGAGQLTGATGNITVNNNALLNIDDTTGGPLLRIAGTRAVGLTNGSLTYTANGAAVSAQAFGALTSSWGANTLTLNNGGGSNATLTFASLAAIGGGSVLSLNSAQTFNGTTNQLIFTALAPQTAGIIARTVIKDGAGTNFATQSAAAAAVTAFSAYTVSNGTGTGGDLAFTNVNGGTAYGINASNVAGVFSATTTYNVTGDTAALSNPGLNGRTLNALRIDGANTDVTFATSGGNQLTLTSGNLLSTAAGQTIGNATLVGLNSAPVINFGAVEGGLLVDTGADLTVNAAIAGTVNMTKGLNGNLTFNTKQFFNTSTSYFTINGGTVTLAGGENTLWQGAQGGTAGQNLAVGPGATLNLGANAQMVGQITSPNRTAFAGTGGVITGTNLLISADTQGTTAGWGGSIQGTGLVFNKAGSTGTVFFSNNTYTGATIITGGTLTLQDEGRLSATSGIALNGGSLTITEAGTMSNADRVNNAATISMRGGVLTYTGRDSINSTETLGDILIAEGGNNIVMNNGAVGVVRSAVLSLGNITNSNGAMLLLNSMSGQMGTAARMTATNGASLLVNGIVPWMNSGGADLVSYVAPTAGNLSGGFAALNQPGYQGYDGTVLPAANNATGNYKVATTAINLPTGGLNVNALALNPGAAQTFTYANSTDILNLTAGLLVKSGAFSTTIGSAVDSGRLTAGGTPDSVADTLNLVLTSAAANIINSRIVDNGADPLRLTYTGYNASTLEIRNGGNTYTGGTVVNTPNGSQTNGIMDLNVTGATGANGNSAIPLATTVADSLIINGGNVRLLQANQINFGITPILRGQFAILQLNNNNQTLAGLAFENNGGTTAPSVTTGTGILKLTGGITAISSNVGTVSTISGAGTGGIALDLNGANRTFNVAPVTVNGNTTVANVTPTLAISAPIGDSAVSGAGMNKTGNGLLQLSGASLFGGGVNVQAGGLAVGGSTNVTTRDGTTGIVSAFANGPIGTGALTIGAAGTYLTSTGANTLSNALVLSGTQITLKGTNNLTIQGNNTTTTLLGNTTVTVDAPQAVLALNMLLDDGGNGYGITKEGLGTLLLGSNNTFKGGVTVNAGTLTLAGLNDNSTAPVFSGTLATIGNGGLLSLQNNGTANNGVISYANNIVINGSLAAASLNVGNNGANTGNTIAINDLQLNGGQILNVSSANGYTLRLVNISGDTVGGAAPMINVASGSTVVVFGWSGDKPVNVGQGNLLFTDQVQIGTTTTLSSGAPIVLNGAYPIQINSAVLTGANMTSYGYSSGGLNGAFAQLAAAPTATVSQAFSGVGFSGSNMFINQLSDGTIAYRPAATAATFTNGAAAYSGFVNITTGGNYTFRSGSDDGLALYLDGVAVASDGTFGHGLSDLANVTLNLTSGYHSIVYKVTNAGSSGGFRLFYSGADTGNSFQSIASSNLFGTLAAPTAANGYNGAAIINNAYYLGNGTTATLDSFGTQFGAVVAPQAANQIDTAGTQGAGTFSMVLGNSSILNVTNGASGSFGTGWFGADGLISIGTGAIIATTNVGTAASAGTLNLIGTITQSGTGLVTGTGASGALIKAGQGTLILGGNNATAGTFTGDLAIQDGTVMLNHVGALPSGLVTVSGTTLTAQAAATTAAGSSVITGITSTASMQQGMAVTGTGIPNGAYIVSVDSASQITISQGATASGSITNLVGATNGMLDVNGLSISKALTINGTGTAPLSGNFKGAIWNSSATAATLSGAITLGSASSIGGYGDLTFSSNITGAFALTKTGTNNLTLSGSGNSFTTLAVNLGTLKLGDAGALSDTTNGTTLSTGAVLDLNGMTIGAEPITIAGAGFGGSGTLSGVGTVSSLAALINSSSTAASLAGPVVMSAATSIGGSRVNALSGVTSGDITLSGVVSGAFTLTKVGTNNLTLTAANTYGTATTGTTTINQGSITLSGSGTLGIFGTTATTLNNATYTGITPDVKLSLDNTGTASSARLGTRGLTLNGGLLEILGNSSTAVNEALATDAQIAINVGYNLISLDNNGANLRITTAGTGTLSRANGATLFIRGDALGQGTGATNTNIILATTTAPTNFQTFLGQAGANGTTNKQILPWAIADTSSTSNGTTATTQFLVNDGATNGLRPLNTSTEMATAFTANANMRVTGALNSGAAATGVTSNSVNSITFENAGPFTVNAFRNLQVESGGILAKTSSSITGAGTLTTTAATTAWTIHTMGSSTTLTLDVALGGRVAPTTGGFFKSGDGKVLLNSTTGNSYTGATIINLGTVEIAAGAPDNAIFYRFATAPLINANTTTANNDALVMTGGLLELNGNNQIFGDLLSRNSTPGSGGIINNAGSLATFITNVGTARDWTGQINGNLNFIKTGGTQLNLRDNNQFTGNATFMGSITTLVDQGRLSGMAAGDTISIRNSLLRWDDSGIQAMSNRISSAVAVNLDGGAFEYISRSGTVGSVTLGNLSVTGGNAVIRANVGNSGLGQATLNLGGTFSRSTGSTLTFTSGGGVLGNNPFVTATAAGLTANTSNIIGGWATVVTNDGTLAAVNAEFAKYDPATGIRQLNGIEQTTTLAAATSTSNVRFSGTQSVINGGQIINSLTLNGAASTVNFAAGTDTLTLASGGLLSGTDNAARTIGSTAVRGRLTTSGSELFLHNGANTLTINSDIGANGAGTFDLVMDAMAQVANTPTINLANANTYTGTAYSNGVLLLLNNQTGSGNAITGSLVVTGGTQSGGDTAGVGNATTRNLGSQQIADTATVTVRGGAAWDLNGFNETVSKLAFQSQGGFVTATNGPGSTFVISGIGTLTLTNTVDTISASALDDVRIVPMLSGRLALPSTATITVAQVAGGLTAVQGTTGQSNEQIGLAINSNILTSGTINKEGAGVLQLGGFSSQTLMVNVNAGTLVLGPSTGTAASNYVSTAINLANTGTILDMRGNSNIVVGTISGATGTFIKNFNVSTGATLVTGDSTSGTFAGTFLSDYTSGLLSVTKVGSGDWTLTGDSSGALLGTLTILGDAVLMDQATGKLGFVTTNLGRGGVLTLNGTGAISDRLGGTTSIQTTTADRVFNNRGGVLNYQGSSSSAVVENLNTVTNLAGQTQWNLTQNTGNQTRINLGTLSAQSAANTGNLVLNAGATGTLGGGAAGANRVTVFATTPTLVGTNPGTSGSVTNGIRPDIIGIDSTNTTGGFVTHDTNGFRLLTSAEYRSLLTSTTGAGVVLNGSMNNSTTLQVQDASNLFAGMAVSGTGIAANSVISSVAGNTITLSAATTGGLQTQRITFGATAAANFVTTVSNAIQQATTFQSLTLNNGGGVGYFSGGNLASTNSPSGQFYGLNGALNTLTITSGGVIANSGNTGFSGGSIISGANPMHFHVLGSGTTLSLGSTILGTGGIVKSDAGTAILSGRSYNTGATTVNNGTLQLGTGLGTNPLLVIPTATVATVADLNVNSGTFDLNGNTQAIRRLTNTTLNI
ncbi:MAG: autotransporter-associated beta strand repeat-containing protein [Verrucomicrobia bacterium]|nr:autotransporter-associated beta strand repeat-containing protein [Verrucomicrobiota bacterium]